MLVSNHDNGMQVLSQASPASLETLKEQLDKLGPQYAYDIDYLNNFLRFKVCVHCLPLPAATISNTAYNIDCLDNFLHFQAVHALPPVTCCCS